MKKNNLLTKIKFIIFYIRLNINKLFNRYIRKQKITQKGEKMRDYCYNIIIEEEWNNEKDYSS